MKKFIIIIFCIFLLFCLTVNKQNNTNMISFSSWGSQTETKILKEIINNFEKESNIKVEFIHIPENYFQKLHLLFASNLEPDVIFINTQNIKMYINANLLEDIKCNFEEDIPNYFQNAIKGFEKDGHLYAMPRDISNLVLYVNKDILKDAKIEYRKKIETLEQLTQILKKLSNEKHYGINYEAAPLYWSYYLAANGGGILSDNGKNIAINKKESIDAINMYSDYINKYKIAPTKAKIGSKKSAQMFINEEIAMYLGGRWMVPKFRETINFDWDIIEFPSSEKNKVYVDSSGWAISSKSKKKENAIKFVKYLTSIESSRKFAKSGLIIPARKETAKDYLIHEKTEKPLHSEIFIDMLKYTKPTPTNKNHSRINDILMEEEEHFFSGKKDANFYIDKNLLNRIESLL